MMCDLFNMKNMVDEYHVRVKVIDKQIKRK